MIELNIDQKIKKHIREFFTEELTLFSAQKKLCAVRGKQIANYNLKQSRQIWMALMIYKFKKEMEATEIIYQRAREVVLGLLRSDSDLKYRIDEYLAEFEKYKEADYTNFVAEIASFYYNILQIKESIQKTEHDVTKSEWEPHYNALIDNIRNKCAKIGCLEALDGFVQTMEIKKYDAVSSVLERVFWDKLQTELQNGQYEMLYANLEELRNYMNEIKNDENVNEEIDIKYIRQRIENDVADSDYWIQLYQFILGFLEENDASAFNERYAHAKLELNNLSNKPLPELITHILEKSFFFVVELKSRMGIWRNLLNSKQQKST